MATLTIDYITSLDGFGAATNWPGFWGLAGREYLDFLGADADPTATMLMGSHTYNEYARMIEAGEPGLDSMASQPIVVFSNSLHEPLIWENARLIAGDAVEAVRELKRGDSPLVTNGSPTLCAALLAAGLVDRYRVVIFPVITGRTGYARIYDGWPDVVLDDVSTRTFDGSLQLVEGRPRILDKPLPAGDVE
ncbi:dihydrofolate reductase family protein [Microbacterium pygmaeum]|uniref:RibD C-terminal domain-containing protein n=1 Tax=Microbacterium pygmaeum TaxID=370764 RepID=A0A1G7Y5N3_9MICO|nr:dihydrofolate reductase family protein [Microbacterium pygmaeum]SDG91677.1 RibD C-terminal domain-containing protein [Microbacterium pygmaeum]